ncbi:MAG: TIGR03016 family PEP-CTERM system-associated outer membrane protein [Pseudomonadota bacterium]
MKLPRNNRSDILLSSVFCAVFVLSALYPTDSLSAEWNLRPMLTVSETYTDNLRLGGVGGGFGGGGFGGFGRSAKKEGDFITQINPGFSLTGTGRRFKLDSNYMMNNLIFAENPDRSRIRHRLSANGTAELMRDLFFVDGSAAIFQQNTSLLGAQTTDNINLTGNRADMRVYSVSPYLRHRFQDFATTELRYTHGIVESSAGGLRNSQRDSYQFSLNSGDYFRILNWGLNYVHNTIHIDGNNFRSGRTIEMERSAANLRYNITPRFGLTAVGGYERNSFISIRGRSSSPFWTAGFVWAPDERTNISVRAGQRFFGPTFGGELDHRTRLTTWNARYSEDITTMNQQAGQFNAFGLSNIDPFGGQALLGLNNFLTNRVFLQKRFQASVTVNGAKNTTTLTVFNMFREAYTPAIEDFELLGTDAALLNKTKQTGGNATWSHRITPRTSVNFNAGFVRFKFLAADRVNDNLIYSVDLTKRFLPNMTGVLQYRRIERDSNQFSTAVANMITASLTMNF